MNIDYGVIALILIIFVILSDKSETIYNFIYGLRNNKLKNKHRINEEVLCTFKDGSVELVRICGLNYSIMTTDSCRNGLYSSSYIIKRNDEYIYAIEVLDNSDIKTPLQEL